VVEAKRTSKSAKLGREQAYQYAQNIRKVHGGDLPLVFYTNGHEHYFWDTEHYPPRRIYGFPTRTDVERLTFLSKERRPLSAEMISPAICGRPFQIEAIRAVLEGIEQRRRKFLLVMATGTGKTRTCAGLVDVLMRARWAERVLFLVDRIALRDQAIDAFREHLPDTPTWPTTEDKGAFKFSRRAYVATYPQFLNLVQVQDAAYISPQFFDLIVADESHRSIYNVYKQVLDYFDAIHLGLTATPTDKIEHDTFELFDCNDNDPTFAFTYEQAIKSEPPYLCDFEVLKVRSKFQLEGIKGETLSAGDQRKLVAEGQDPEDIDFEGTDLERKVTNSGTNRLIVKEFMEESIKDADGTLPGKSIIFAISKGHAARLEEIFDALYPEHKGKLARVIVSEDPRVYGKGGLLDQFKTQDMPRVTISVDMLDTGIDVLEIVNLVFAKETDR
jgi:type I restriction enzyme R subunit